MNLVEWLFVGVVVVALVGAAAGAELAESPLNPAPTPLNPDLPPTDPSSND